MNLIIKQPILIFITILILIVISTGCTKQEQLNYPESIIGSWEVEGGKAHDTWTFWENGSFIFIGFEVKPEGTLTANQSGKYSISDDNLHILWKITQVERDGIIDISDNGNKMIITWQDNNKSITLDKI